MKKILYIIILLASIASASAIDIFYMQNNAPDGSVQYVFFPATSYQIFGEYVPEKQFSEMLIINNNLAMCWLPLEALR